MAGDFQSVAIGTSGLALASATALSLTILRAPLRVAAPSQERAVDLFLIGLAAQCLHFLEEFLTQFQNRFPLLLGLPPWSAGFFVAFNLGCLCLWVLSAVGLRRRQRWAFFPAWFFAIASLLNGVAHPLLAVAARGYFPGLLTSPAVGIIGWLLWRKLWVMTRRAVS